MENPMLKMSRHARIRAAQRAVREDHIQFTLDWGTQIRQSQGRSAFHLGRKDWLHARRMGVNIPESAKGVVVVSSTDGTLVTVVRSNRRRRLKMRRKIWRIR
jgi:hypothetical protein